MLTRAEILERLRELRDHLTWKSHECRKDLGQWSQGVSDYCAVLANRVDELIDECDADAPGDAPTTGDTEP